ncbi:hypothetical protein J6590_012532 [Homalodisca vitripennis]|nr:hypothetical protein J6590_012532 [Homalodisca vitripennis]
MLHADRETSYPDKDTHHDDRAHHSLTRHDHQCCQFDGIDYLVNRTMIYSNKRLSLMIINAMTGNIRFAVCSNGRQEGSSNWCLTRRAQQTDERIIVTCHKKRLYKRDDDAGDAILFVYGLTLCYTGLGIVAKLFIEYGEMDIFNNKAVFILAGTLVVIGGENISREEMYEAHIGKPARSGLVLVSLYPPPLPPLAINLYSAGCITSETIGYFM